MLVLMVVLLVIVAFLLIGTICHEVLGAATIVTSPFLLVWEPPLHKLVPIGFQPLVIFLDK
jgi:hypothetical protein